ncbi:MAG: xanthine dehydrogenase family protein molybdopterin-binding subunit [Thiofilum sp.]|uniref:xanthine dehydrogenase family protein molybdopterin-binding subunit n=1 Tax=Thiofilum sp. TaxID=2212733 RepID=UPI0025CF4F27|nr:xanthine dehydrogenase family protein molybdopterin-binding subunit [Thiofilum sp.]MBK8454134.1 xanthine dehydrogenase family protein molybdopterin-binding subunit [Thiofilum sp.]
MSIMNLSRRQWLKSTAVAGASLTLGVYFNGALAEEASTASTPAANAAASSNFEPNAFVRINPDNTVTIIIKHLEMGQGSHTGLASLVADELDADWALVKTEHAPADASRYNNLSWGPLQGTGGSSSLANSFMQMREAGATAKAMLVGAAAALWSVPASEIQVAKSTVFHKPSQRQATFGELVGLAAQQPVPTNLTLKTPDQFIYIGKNNLSRIDASAKTNGTAQYTQDVHLPNMLVAVVAHAPRFGATVKSFDATQSKAIKGFVDAVSIGNAVAVLAQDFWSAKQGRDVLQIEWDENQAFKLSSADLLKQYQDLAQQKGAVARQEGEVEPALSKAAQVLSAAYEFPYLAHAAMEPMNCVVQLKEGQCEIWNGDQIQTLDQMMVAKLLSIEPQQVKINTLMAGGSFGRRGNPQSDYVLEAARIAQASKRDVPIKMVWTREDDTRAGQYRPYYYHVLKAGLDKEGNLMAWQQRIVGQSIMANTVMAGMIQNGIDPTSVEGAAGGYAIPNLSIELHTTDIGIPIQWWRSVGHTHTGYATEVFIDELAAAAGQDPLAFRVKLLEKQPRLLGVLKLAAEKANWSTPLQGKRGRGIAVVESFNSYVAEVAEITVRDDGTYSVDRVVVAIDCGWAVNPDVVYAQMSGGVGFGLSAALSGKITLKEGKVEQSNFHDYPVLRINQMPKVEVHIVNSAEKPTGVGEPAVPPIAPAVANALSAVTGKRYYTLPLPTQV